MLGETITITHNAVARVLTRNDQGNYASEYFLRTATDEFLLYVRHAKESAKAGVVPFERHNIEFIHTKFATLTMPEQQQRAAYTVRCRRGDDPAEALLSAKALNGWLTDANVTKLIAWES